MRLWVTIAGLPFLLGTAVVAPWLGVAALAVLYFVRPAIWGAPDWLQPVQLLTVATLVGLLGAALGRRVRLRIPGPLLFAALFVASAWLSSDRAWLSRPMALARTEVYLKCAVSTLLVAFLLDRPGRLRAFAVALVVGTLWLVKSALVLATTANPDRVDAIGGQGGGANFLAQMIVLSAPILLLWLLEGRRGERLAALLLAPFWLTAIVLSGSRGGFLALFAVVFLYVLSTRRRLVALVFGAAAVAFLLAVAPRSYLERMESIREYERDLSATHRLELWGAALEMAAEHPVTGVGPDNFRLLSTRYTSARQARTGVGLVAHNTFLQALAEQGGLGLLLLLAAIVLTFTGFRRAARDAPETEEGERLRLLARAFALGFAGFLVQGVFLSCLHTDVLWWWFGLGAAAPVAAAAALPEPVPRPDLTSRPGGPAARRSPPPPPSPERATSGPPPRRTRVGAAPTGPRRPGGRPGTPDAPGASPGRRR